MTSYINQPVIVDSPLSLYHGKEAVCIAEMGTTEVLCKLSFGPEIVWYWKYKIRLKHKQKSLQAMQTIYNKS